MGKEGMTKKTEAEQDIWLPQPINNITKLALDFPSMNC